MWDLPLRNAGSPIDAMSGIVQVIARRPEDLECGRQLNDLSEEMLRLTRGSEEGPQQCLRTGMAPCAGRVRTHSHS